MSQVQDSVRKQYHSGRRITSGRRQLRVRPALERLEDRTLPSVTIAPTNNSGQGYAALDYNQSGGYIPPDTCGAAGPMSYVETVNQTVALYGNKAAGTPATTSDLGTFWYTTGGLPPTDGGSFLSDPIVVYDDLIGRFIVGDQDVDSNTLISNFDIAVSTSSNPLTLSKADWTFYQINTTESGFDADYPGNFGYNADAFVFTLNMFGSATDHVQIVSVSSADLAANATSPAVYHNDFNGFSLRPTVMHDAVAGDPMWLLTEHGDNQSIDVIQMSNVLSNGASFITTNLAVTPYSTVVPPLDPGGVITYNIDSRILKAAEWNHTLVAAHHVSVSPTQDVVQWYRIDVSSGAPVLADQGRVGAGNNTYLTYPGIDINASGQIGMTYIKQGDDTTTDYMSMYITGHDPSDGPGTMQTPVLVPAGTGQADYVDFGQRQGDLSGINVDPNDGSFWAANEFANTEGGANWGTAVANFTVSTGGGGGGPVLTSLQIQAPASVNAGVPFTATVNALDQNGNIFATYTGTVQFSTTDPAAILPGPYTFNTTSDNGSHTFFNQFTMFTAGQRVLTVTDVADNLTAIANIYVNPGTVTSMAYIQQPLDTYAGNVITPAVSVGLYDQYGNLLANDYSDTVTIAIGNNPSNGTLSGTLTQTVSGGVATFNDLSINAPGARYSLVASTALLPGSVQSGAFTIKSVYNPPGNVIEDFENLYSEPWTDVGGSPNEFYGQGPPHDGNSGLDITGPDWIYRNDAPVQVKAGDQLSVWMQLWYNLDGRAYFGFGSSANGTLALVAAPNTNQLLLMSISRGYSTYTTLGAVNYSNFQYGTWYRMQVSWSLSGAVTGSLFASNGTTLLARVGASVSSTGITSGGIAFRGLGTDKLFDTVIDQPGVGGGSGGGAPMAVKSGSGSSTKGTGLPLPAAPVPRHEPQQSANVWTAAMAEWLTKHHRITRPTAHNPPHKTK